MQITYVFIIGGQVLTPFRNKEQEFEKKYKGFKYYVNTLRRIFDDKNDDILACGILWNQCSYKQLIVKHYSLKYKIIRRI